MDGECRVVVDECKLKIAGKRSSRFPDLAILEIDPPIHLTTAA